MPLRKGFMTITGEIQGTLVGPSSSIEAPESIEIVDIEHQVSHEYNPTLGVQTGDRHHSELSIYKEVDLTTPALYQMCCTAERLTEVKIQYYVQTGGSMEAVEFFSWTLEDAIVTQVRQIPARELGGEFAEQYDLMEAVSFSYQHMTWDHYAHRAASGMVDLTATTAADSWSRQA